MKQNQQQNGVYFGASEALTNVKILSKSMDSRELKGPEARPSQTSVLLTAGSGSSMSSNQSSGSTNGRSSSNFAAKQQGRWDSLSLNRLRLSNA